MAMLDDFLQDVVARAADNFKKSQAILSFDQFIAHIMDKPKRHLRNCAQYFIDMWSSFGTYDVVTPAKTFTRYRLFDAEFANKEGRIFGQEQVQHELFTHIYNFARSGKIDKLLLLHGPNGSSKTSIVQVLTHAAEAYSRTDEGALYQFSWVFPKKEKVSARLGFGDDTAEKCKSYAFLPDDEVDARILSDLKDHPLLLFTPAERSQLFDMLKSQKDGDWEQKISEGLKVGELSHKNRQIFDALLSSYNGDLRQVFRHVRVERFYFSRRYKKGISVVEPQMSVDAEVRQLTADQSILSLPAALRHVALYETLGPLVEANRGLIEYSDLLKRPLEAWKYLLVACEQAQVSVGTLSLFFDLLMIATSNELHLHSFREYPDWQSFKGRIELIRVPYLLRSVDEENIYLHQVKKALSHMHIAPHSIEMAARFAVLTRLEPPMPHKYPASLQDIIRDLTPEEKLELYNFGDVPTRLSQQQARELKVQIPQLFYEYYNDPNYEGRFGASPREIRVILLNAAQDRKFDHLSALAIFSQIEQLIEQRSSYEFLRREPLRGYRDANFLLTSVKQYYASILEDEVRNALGFFSKESYLELFTRYIMHVSAWTKKERLVDPLLQREVDADEQFMSNIESNLLAQNETKEDFRRQMIAQIGAYKLENPSSPLDYTTLFSTHLRRLKESVYKDQKNTVHRIIRVFLRMLQGDTAGLDERELKHAATLKEGLSSLGYSDSSARQAMAFLVHPNGRDALSNKNAQPSLLS
ncbi:MAG TPA: serine protein kinase PrkA [Myxococcota bacterium]|nr:serine protein kinase PrkA [Myxococcota bacterium]